MLQRLRDGEELEPELTSSSHFNVFEFLRDEHPLLSMREKMILRLRFCSPEIISNPTLAIVGKELGLSKERVRQVQALALDKLKKALLEENLSTISQ